MKQFKNELKKLLARVNPKKDYIFIQCETEDLWEECTNPRGKPVDDEYLDSLREQGNWVYTLPREARDL